MADDEDYVFTKEELSARGIERMAKGFYKPDILDRYLERGYLNFKGLYSGVDRFSAARRLSKDFYLSRFAGLKASDYAKERVDVSGVCVTVDTALDARQRYFSAIRAVNQHFRYAVRQVCVEDTGPEVFGTSRHQQKLDAYIFKMDLCRGLDDLVSFYQSKNR